MRYRFPKTHIWLPAALMVSTLVTGFLYLSVVACMDD